MLNIQSAPDVKVPFGLSNPSLVSCPPASNTAATFPALIASRPTLLYLSLLISISSAPQLQEALRSSHRSQIPWLQCFQQHSSRSWKPEMQASPAENHSMPTVSLRLSPVHVYSILLLSL